MSVDARLRGLPPPVAARLRAAFLAMADEAERCMSPEDPPPAYTPAATWEGPASGGGSASDSSTASGGSSTSGGSFASGSRVRLRRSLAPSPAWASEVVRAVRRTERERSVSGVLRRNARAERERNAQIRAERERNARAERERGLALTQERNARIRAEQEQRACVDVLTRAAVLAGRRSIPAAPDPALTQEQLARVAPAPDPEPYMYNPRATPRTPRPLPDPEASAAAVRRHRQTVLASGMLAPQLEPVAN